MAKKPAKITIATADDQPGERNGCRTCAAAQLVAGGLECHHMPPTVTNTGRSVWPTVNPDTGWCTQWHGVP